ncbi:MAG: hypothetical protein HY904_23150 [Deltaproteobacteria bacterium]|nr:hypothetical protein [Deltaproteobacteria bacterium]
MSKPRLEDSPHVVCVEDYSDLLFIAEVLEEEGVKGVFIKEFPGKQAMKTQLDRFSRRNSLAKRPALASSWMPTPTQAGRLPVSQHSSRG